MTSPNQLRPYGKPSVASTVDVPPVTGIFLSVAGVNAGVGAAGAPPLGVGVGVVPVARTK